MDKKHQAKWRRAADQIKLEPDARVWNRLEQRLDQDYHKIPLARIKSWIGIAASVIVLVSVGLYFLTSTSPPDRDVVIHELEETPEVTFAAYRHVSDINNIYASEGWKQINEGSHAPLIFSAGDTNNGPSAIRPEAEDTLY